MSITPTQAAEIQALYVDGGLSTPKLAERFGVSIPTIRNTLLKRGVQMKSQGRSDPRPWRSKFHGEQVEEIRRRIEAGENLASIGRAMGTSQTTIDSYAKELGLHTPRKDIAAHADEIKAKLAVGAHVDDIAAELGTTRATVYSVVARTDGSRTIDISKQYRASVRPSKEEQNRTRYQREKERAAIDPEFRAQMEAKQQRQYVASETKYASTMAKFHAHGCVKCGEKRVEGLDAHHRNPEEKKFDIASRSKLRVTVEELEQELAKCDCLCAYCHRVLHYEQGDNQPNPNAKSKTARQVAEARIRLKPLFDEFYKDGCWACGRQHPEHAGLTPHHVYPELKLFNISKAFGGRLSNELVQAEFDKCACLCETCHRLVHAEVIECPKEPFAQADKSVA